MTEQNHSPRPHPIKALVRRKAVQSSKRQIHLPVQESPFYVESEQNTPAEYGPDTVLHAEEDSAGAVMTVMKDTAITSFRKFRVSQLRRAQRLRFPPDGGSVPVEQPTEYLSGTTILPPDQRRRNVQKTRYRQIAAAKRNSSGDTIQVPVANQKPDAKKDLFRRQLFQREAVLRFLQKKSGQPSQAIPSGSVLSAPAASVLPSTSVPKLPGLSTGQQTAAQIRFAATRFVAAVKAALVNALKKSAVSLLSLAGAGGIVLLLAIIVATAAAVIGSPMGILFANETGDPNSIPIAEIVRETNGDFGTSINDIVNEHPECRETEMHYDYEDGHTWAGYWPEILALFAVYNNLSMDQNVIVIDENSKESIQDIFWTMHQIEYEIEDIEVIPEQPEEPEESEETESEEPEEPEEPPQPIIEHILHITVSSKSVEELAEEYHLNTDQRDILHELLSDSMRPSLLALCGGLTGDGTLQWPLPGHSSISCYFGDVDAFGRAGHHGIDIPAGEGTPILAANSGTVLAAGWNDSYGNQILLDDGAGLSTRYAHMIATAVAPGELVTAGQVIGYVGSTGDSTGNHLHFEVMQAGVRIDPLSIVQPQ